MSEDRTSSDVMVEAFLAAGVRDIFSVVGGGNLLPMIAAVEAGIADWPARHESGAVAMAGAYAHATGRVGVATTTRGPGFANAFTALITVARDRLPVVLYTADSLEDERWGNQYLDQGAVAATAGARFVSCTDPALIADRVELAFAMAKEERCAVVLSVPGKVVESAAVPQTRTPLPIDRQPPTAPPEPDGATIERIVAAVQAAERPVIIAGRGAVASDARDVLERLGDRTGALLATTLPANGFFHGNEAAIGIAGGFALPGRRRLLEQADLVLAFGAGLTSYTTSDGKIFRDATIVQVDREAGALGLKHRVDVALHADAAAAAGAVLDGLDGWQRDGAGFRDDAVLETLRTTHRGQDLPDASGPEGLDPRGFLRTLDDALPASRRIVIDLGHHATFSSQTMTVTYPGQLYNAYGFSSLGLALASAVGLTVAAPDDVVVAFVGDGGLCMSLTELETVSRLAPNLVIVVMNDRGYGAEVHKAGRNGWDPTIARFPETPFTAIAESLGITAATIAGPEDIDRVPGLIADRAGPLLLDVRTHPFVIGASRYGRATEGAAPAGAAVS